MWIFGCRGHPRSNGEAVKSKKKAKKVIVPETFIGIIVRWILETRSPSMGPLMDPMYGAPLGRKIYAELVDQGYLEGKS